MNFISRREAEQYRRSQEIDIPALRGRLKTVRDTVTVWGGDQLSKKVVYVVVMK